MTARLRPLWMPCWRTWVGWGRKKMSGSTQGRSRKLLLPPLRRQLLRGPPGAACNSEEIDLLDDDATPAAEQAGAGMQELMFSREPEAADHQQLVGVNAHCQDKLVLA